MLTDYGQYMAYIPDDITAKECVIFDFDGTLVVKANGRPLYESETDESNFVILSGVVELLTDLIENDIQIVVVSNQSRLTQAKQNQFRLFNERFDNKLMFLVAHLKNEYRKPDIGFSELLSQFEISAVCGDAVGPESENPSFRWGNSDKMFAANLGVNFVDPIEAFGSNSETISPDDGVIIMMGNPGSGKTTLSRRLEDEGRIRFSQDEYGGKLNTKTIKSEMEHHLKEGQSIIIDATHSSAKNRAVWIDLAKKCDVTYVILWCVRDGRPFNALREKPVKPVAYGVYSKYFERPDEHAIVIS